MNKYILKQNKFKCLVKSIQQTINPKIYKNQGVPFEKYVRATFNISK